MKRDASVLDLEELEAIPLKSWLHLEPLRISGEPDREPLVLEVLEVFDHGQNLRITGEVWPSGSVTTVHAASWRARLLWPPRSGAKVEPYRPIGLWARLTDWIWRLTSPRNRP